MELTDLFPEKTAYKKELDEAVQKTVHALVYVLQLNIWFGKDYLIVIIL